MRSLPLEAEHARLGATFTELGGWRTPRDYGDPASEQRAVHRGAGLVDWSAKARTRVTGEDRVSFLDGVLTNDVKTLAKDRGMYAATLDHKGRVHGDLVLYNRGDHYLLVTEPEATESVLAHVNKLLVSDDASLEDASAEACTFGLFGPRSPDLAANLLEGSLPHEAYEVGAGTREGTTVLAVRSPYFGVEGYELWIPRDAAETVWRALLAAGAAPFGRAAEEALRIEAGRPRFPADMNERTIVLEARLEGAISMTKGCYVGQEVVSRATYVGRVNRALVGLSIDAAAPPAPGVEVHADGKAVGHLTSVARSARLDRTIALGYVRREFAEPGTALTLREGAALVEPLPFP